jgi:hypothetical protein
MMGERHWIRGTLDLSVQAYGTGHPGVMYSCLDEGELGRKQLMVPYLHLDEGDPSRNHPVVPHLHLD